ncbi:endo-1,4-beta-xylanase [Salipaludibacillus sp. HK11]|uniref:endo-1,4-beta-xylanase n=1 Tax=Salipaludibacillus sp. HK11 TaxID=3394320 RepID=UPI0039FD568D
MKSKRFKSTIIKLLVLMLVLPPGLINFSASAAAEEGNSDVSENIVIHHDFETEDTNGWEPLGWTSAADVETTDEAASTGEQSLKFFNRDDRNSNLALNLTDQLVGGESYTLSFDVQMSEGLDMLRLASKYVYTGTDNEYPWIIGNQEVGSDGWTTFENENFVYDEETTELIIYIESDGEGDAPDFYIDNFKVTKHEVDETPEPEEPVGDLDPNEIAFFDFEDNADGFSSNGDASILRTTDASHSGDYSLSVTGRTADWHGARVTLTESIYPTATYRVTGYAKAANFDDNEVFKATVDNGDYTTFAQVDITSDEWTEFTGEYQARIGEEQIAVYFESSKVASEFYLDNIKFEMIAPPEDVDDSEPAENFEMIDFEDTSLHEDFNGFEARGGEEELSIVEGVNRTEDGNYSLLTENRTEEWNGPMINVFDYVDLGSEYEVSVWVRMKEPASANVQLKAQIGSGDGASYPDIASGTVTSDEWVNLSGTYNFSSSGGGNLAVYLESDNANESFYIDDFSFVRTDSAPINIQPDLPSIKDVYEGDFLIGNAITMGELEGVRLELLQKHFNLVTAENAMKPQYVHDADGNLNFDGQNEFVQASIDAGFKVHGHAITWHSQSNYDILFPEGISREDAIDSLETYIEAAITNYAQFGDDIVSWDILNEAIVVRGAPYEDWKDHLRSTRALEVIGDDYIQIIFEKAKEVRDDLGLDFTLFYNDYNDHLQDKAQIMYYMVKDINETYQTENNTDELLIEGIGMQSHYNNNLNPANVEQSMDRFISLGVDIGVTELDVMAGSNYVLTEEEANRQAYIYASVFEIYKERSEHISRVTFWGLDDGQSWRSEQNPLIFDSRLQAKPAFYGVIDPPGYLEDYEETDVPARQSQAVYTDQAPTIDGAIDSVWDDAVVMTGNRAQQAWQTATADTHVLWDEEFLYVLLEVGASELDDTNANPWEHDSVEVFLDQNNTKQASYATNEGFGQYRVNFNNLFSEGSGGPYDGVESATTVNGTNYTVEMKIPLYAIEPVDGDVIGFDFQVNDAENGERRGVMAWNDLSGQGFSDPSVFGELTLVSDLDPETEEQRQIRELQELVDELNQRIAELHEENGTLQEQVDSLEQQIADLELVLEGQGATLADLQDKINELISDIEDLNAQIGELTGNDGTGTGDGSDTNGETVVSLGEWVTLYGETKLVIEGLKASIGIPADIPPGTDIMVETYTPNDEKDKNGKALTPAGEAITVTMNFPEGEEEYKGEFILELGINDDAENPDIYYHTADGWELVVGDVDDEVIRITVSGFSTYGVFEVDPSEPDSTDPTDPEPSDPVGNGDGTGDASYEKGGETLPDTATNNFTMLLIGLLTLLAGAIIFAVVYRRKHLMN